MVKQNKARCKEHGKAAVKERVVLDRRPLWGGAGTWGNCGYQGKRAKCVDVLYPFEGWCGGQYGRSGIFKGYWEKFKEVDHLKQTSAGDLFGIARSIARLIWPYTGNQVKLLVQCLYSFPIVATTNYYNLSNTNLSYSSGGQKSKMGQQDCIPSGGSRGESVFLPLLVCRGPSHSLAHGLFLRVQSQQHSIFSSLTSAPAFPSSPSASDPVASLF